MSIIVYNEVAEPIIPAGDLAGPVRDALGVALRSMRYVSPDFAGLYQDATGGTPVTAAGQPVGLMLDRRFGLARGSDVVSPFSFLDGRWSIGSSAGFLDDRRFYCTAGPRSAAFSGLVVGRIYELDVSITRTNSAGTVGIFNSQTAANPLIPFSTSLTLQARLLFSASNPAFGFRVSDADEVTVNALSIHEVPGNHASQPTTTARPTLRSGPLRIDYDGVDDYLRTVFPDLGGDVTIARSIPGVGAQILTGQTISAGNWDDNVTSCATLVIDRALTGPETALVTAFLNQQAGV